MPHPDRQPQLVAAGLLRVTTADTLLSIAFLLNANGGRTGASELPLDVAELEKIVITTEQR